MRSLTTIIAQAEVSMKVLEAGLKEARAFDKGCSVEFLYHLLEVQRQLFDLAMHVKNIDNKLKVGQCKNDG